jgi:hypothetical protein
MVHVDLNKETGGIKREYSPPDPAGFSVIFSRKLKISSFTDPTNMII